MFRYLPFAALAAAAGTPFAAAAWTRYERPNPLPASSPSAATGHLALVRAHPGLRDLNALLTPGTFLVDATHALLACVLRGVPFHPWLVRKDIDFFSAEMRSAESKGDVEQVALYRLQLALRYARDGRQEDALNAFAQVAAEHPGYADDAARIYASALCYLLGRPEEGHRWLAGDDHSPSDIYNTFMFMDAVKIATFGSTPHAVEASRKLVVFSALGLVEIFLWSAFVDGDLAKRLQVLAFMVFLRRAVAKRLREDDTGEFPFVRTPSQAR
ncbi:hypothetical protein GUJ93_ZPchr0001g31600 [Zizania palustris]|uniref:Uncharacterized protein n=1 Tax=Zizania palustris TaxID=103762 RepID=A0A8J5RPX0_ZIZPA|nr:hypothetical protein GUJ93_ZPchr0001g31600 [Zizania palustris]